jgi:predicted nucleic acid-binding protein
VAEFVLDTSAIMALLWDEEGASDVENILKSDDAVFVPFVALMEAEYKLLRRDPVGAEDVMQSIRAWPVSIVESNPAWGHEAAVVKQDGGLSFADAWIASLAISKNVPLVHKDPEFDRVDTLQHLRLPYKASSR